MRRAAGFAELTDEVLAAVLDLLAGRYPSEEFGELRPRIVWDRVNGDRSGPVTGAKRLAVTSGGTIPDRGLFGVFLPDGTRVGELDEEMVYESRPGETFLLGASTWRIEDITFERVVVTPAPGQPGKMPFWHGDRPGRPLELGRALGAFVREIRERLRRRRRGAAPPTTTGSTAGRPTTSCSTSTSRPRPPGVVPDDRTIVVERFRDEIGDWRVCVLRPFGTPVHAPWAMAIERRLSERYGMPVETMWSDDGIVIRLPEAVDELPVDELLIDPTRSTSWCCPTLPATSLFSSRFRECAARALLLPRRRPDSRTPLWQQRQRAADLLAVAAKYPTFPILLEASRECLQDVFDVPALRRCWPTCAVAHDPGGDASTPRRRRRSRRACCSTGSRPTCTRATRRWPSGAPPRSGPRPRPAARAARRRGAARADRPRRPGRPRARAAVPRRHRRRARTPTSCTTCCAGSAT